MIERFYNVNEEKQPLFSMTKGEVSITGVVLSGGRARRMGGHDKGLILLRGEPLVQHVIRRMRPQVQQLIVNANRHRPDYEAFGCPVVGDSIGEYFGPLAGMLAAMEYMTTDYLLTAPCDSPLLPVDYAERMVDALESNAADICVASDGNRLQPVFALLPGTLAADLRSYLQDDGRKIDRWFGRHKTANALFTEKDSAIFRNINTEEDLAALEAGAE